MHRTELFPKLIWDSKCAMPICLFALLQSTYCYMAWTEQATTYLSYDLCKLCLIGWQRQAIFWFAKPYSSQVLQNVLEQLH